MIEYRPDNKDDIATTPLEVKDGYIAVPESPGIGVELDEAAVAKYNYTPRNIGTALRADDSIAFR